MQLASIEYEGVHVWSLANRIYLNTFIVSMVNPTQARNLGEYLQGLGLR